MSQAARNTQDVVANKACLFLISFQVEPPSPWIVHHRSKTHARRKPSGLELIRFPVLGLPTGRIATLGISRACSSLFHMSFNSPYPSTGSLGVGVERLNCCFNCGCNTRTGWSSCLGFAVTGLIVVGVRCRAVHLSRTTRSKIFPLVLDSHVPNGPRPSQHQS